MQRLYTKIKLEIVGADIIIEDADIVEENKKNHIEKYENNKIKCRNPGPRAWDYRNEKAHREMC